MEDEYPPELFKTELEQLSKLHVPITAHAGENASVQFVERACWICELVVSVMALR
jgi:adenosine deaminase